MVLNKGYILVVMSAVLVLIASQSNGSEIQQCANEFEEGLSNAEYRTRHQGALDAIDEVNNEADQAQQDVRQVNEEHAINKVRKAFLDCIKCVAVAGDRAYEANQNVEESSDSEDSKQEINEGNTAAKKGVAVAGIAAYQGLGSATEIAGNYSKQSLKESIKFVTFAGQIAYSGLDKAKLLVTVGVNAGGPAKKQGLTASNEAIEATGSACYFNLLKSAKIAFGGIDRSRPSVPEEASLGTEAARKSPEASSAIEYVNNIPEGAFPDAMNTVKNGIIAAIRGVAAAFQKLQKALETESEKRIKEATRQADNDIAYAAANGYQSLGMAEEKVGGKKKNRLGQAMSAFEVGRAEAYESLQAARFLALTGLENGETASEAGLKTAADAVLTAAFAAYAEFMTAADIASDILNSL